MKPCEHFGRVRVQETDVYICRECVATGSRWVHLRLCMACGHVGCCDASPNRHARSHFEATSHPVIRSAEPDERWAYCYLDDQFVESVGVSREIERTENQKRTLR